MGNLDKRGIGDVTTLTVEEYTKLSNMEKVFVQTLPSSTLSVSVWLHFSFSWFFIALQKNT